MPRRAAKKPSDDFPEFPVKRKVFCAMFTPPLPKSTFYDRVKDGKIIPLKGVSGYFLMNKSRRLMGLPPVLDLPHEHKSHSLQDITRLTFTLIDPITFPAPPWLLGEDAIPAGDFSHANLLVEKHRQKVEAIENIHLKLAYFSGVLDAAVLTERDLSAVVS